MTNIWIIRNFDICIYIFFYFYIYVSMREYNKLQILLTIYFIIRKFSGTRIINYNLLHIYIYTHIYHVETDWEFRISSPNSFFSLATRRARKKSHQAGYFRVKFSIKFLLIYDRSGCAIETKAENEE